MALSRCIGSFSVLMLAVATPVFGQSGFYGQDRNGDGVITKDEWSGSKQSFRERDSNDDGVLSGNELPSSMRTRRQTQDRNGGLDRSDRRNRNDERYRNEDQSRNYDRYGNEDQSRNDNRTRSDSRNNYEDRSEGSRNRRALRSGQNVTIDQLDKNRNGVVEGNEWPYNAKVFHELDRNSDSVLSADELRNTSLETLRNLDGNGNSGPSR